MPQVLGLQVSGRELHDAVGDTGHRTARLRSCGGPPRHLAVLEAEHTPVGGAGHGGIGSGEPGGPRSSGAPWCVHRLPIAYSCSPDRTNRTPTSSTVTRTALAVHEVIEGHRARPTVVGHRDTVGAREGTCQPRRGRWRAGFPYCGCMGQQPRAAQRSAPTALAASAIATRPFTPTSAFPLPSPKRLRMRGIERAPSPIQSPSSCATRSRVATSSRARAPAPARRSRSRSRSSSASTPSGRSPRR